MSNLAKSVYQSEPIPKSAYEAVEKLLDTADLFRYTADADAPVSILEKEFANLMGSKYALAVSSCSAALFLSMRALNVDYGSKVLVPAFTFGAVPSAIVHAGAIPILVECGSNYRINMDDFKLKLTDDIDAVIISHMRGHTSDMDQIMALCDEKGIPVIEDAAHSLGTTWSDKKIGTIGKIGCFSFQSYKMINGGEGGILITDDDEIFARTAIMSGAYEHMWKKHPRINEYFKKWQNKLPLYNTRMNNLSAAVITPQITELEGRVARGRFNHDYVAERLNSSTWIDVPDPLKQEKRAPDSLQFNLVKFSDDEVDKFVQIAKESHINVQVFGRTEDNARAFWNWQFIGEIPELPETKAMLMRACDTRLPAHLTKDELDEITTVILSAANKAKEVSAFVKAS